MSHILYLWLSVWSEVQTCTHFHFLLLFTICNDKLYLLLLFFSVWGQAAELGPSCRVGAKLQATVGAKLQATNRVPRPVDRGTATRYGG